MRSRFIAGDVLGKYRPGLWTGAVAFGRWVGAVVCGRRAHHNVLETNYTQLKRFLKGETTRFVRMSFI